MRVDQLGFLAYLVDYVNEELDRGATEVTHEMVCNAIEAFEGGAHDGRTYTVRAVATELFDIDASSEDPYLWVSVKDRGDVQIKCEEEGIVVDIYAKPHDDVYGEPVASTWAHINDLMEDEE